MAASIAIAFADTVIVKRDTVTGDGSTVTMQDTARAWATAEIIFDNRNVNGGGDNGTYDLRHRDMTASFEFVWGATDIVIVTPPDGMVCFPADCTMDIPEDQVGTLYLYSVEGVGM